MTATIGCRCGREGGHDSIMAMCPACRRAQIRAGLGTCMCCRASMDRNGTGVCEECITAGCSRRMGLWKRASKCPLRVRNKKAGAQAWSRRKEVQR